MPSERPASVNCPPVAELIAFVAGRLTGSDAAEIGRHVEGCSECYAQLLEMEVYAGETQRVEGGDDDGSLDSTLGSEPSADGPPGSEPSSDGSESSDSDPGSPPRSSTEPPESILGRTLDRKYRLVRVLGRGGMGSVYEAEHLGTSRRVAVKLINRRLLAQGGDGPRRFRREARAAGGIDSAHIVQILDSGADDATRSMYIVMEYLRGEDLQSLLDRVGPLPPDVALRVAAQALLGLQKAHEAGIVHRDIKPANIFLARRDDGDLTVKLLDFGIAKVTVATASSAHTSGITYSGGFLGSPLYMSPEQVQSSKDVDHRADLWSLGSALYCALSGIAPYERVRGVGKLILAICSLPAPPLRSVAPWVPPEVAEVVHGALAIDPAKRYPSAAAMLDALRHLLPDGFALREDMLVGLKPEERTAPEPEPASEPEPAPISDTAPAPVSDTAPAPISDTAPAPISDTAPAPAPAEPPARPRRALRWGAVAALAAAVITCGVLVGKAWIRGKRSDIAAEPLASFSPLPSSPTTEDPILAQQIELGRALFYDPRLSKNGDIACTTCHPLERYAADGRRLSRGSDGREPPRNTLSVYNVSGFFTLLWDGRQDNLVDQAKEVLLSPRAMAASKEQLPARLKAIPTYAGAFARAFPGDPDPVSFDNTARALAAFESTLVTRGRWDRFLEGDRTALGADEKAGFNRFVEVGCISCHFGPNVGATMFQKAGLVRPWPDTRDKGRYEITKREVDRMVFRVPSLRNVAETAPYFHDGSVASLDQAIRMMARHQIGRELDDEDVTLIRSWLVCLTGEIPERLRAGAPQ